MTGSSLCRARLTNAILSHAVLKGADLSYSDLSYADLDGADLSGADLTATDFSWATLTNANLRGATLTATSLMIGQPDSRGPAWGEVHQGGFRKLDSAPGCSRRISLRQLRPSFGHWPGIHAPRSAEQHYA